MAVAGLLGPLSPAGPGASAALLSACNAGPPGAAWSWGANSTSQLGDGTNVGSPTPAEVSTLGLGAGVVEVAAGGAPTRSHSLALTASGTVLAWGDNSQGQLGDGTSTQRSTPVRVVLPGPATTVAAGDGFSLAVVGGSVWGWGASGSGQLGTATGSGAVRQVGGLSLVVQVAAGAAHGLALEADGSVWAWGSDGSGLGDGVTTTSQAPIRVALPGPSTKVAANGDHNLAITLADGAVWGWGDNASGELGNGGRASQPVPVQAAGLTGVASVTTAADHSLGVDGSGAAWAWGSDAFAQLGGAFSVTDGATIAGSTTLTSAGAGFGAGDVGRPVSGAGIPPGTGIASVTSPTAAILSAPATATAGGVALTFGSLGSGGSPVPLRVRGITGVTGVAGGGGHSLAVRADGSSWGWGDNSSGQLGQPAAVAGEPTPTIVPGLTHAAAVAAGAAYSLAVVTGGAGSVTPCSPAAPQSTPAGAPFGAPLSVQVRDQSGSPVAGVAVTFTAPASGAGGTFAGGTATVVATSDPAGVATPPAFTANDIAGAYTVTAGAAAFEPAPLFLTNTAGPPAAVTAVSGGNQLTRVTTSFAMPLAARVSDAFGNPVAAQVTFTVQPGAGGAGATFPAGALSVNVPSGADGVATAPTVLGNASPGPFTVTARVAGVAAGATFSLANTANPVPASIAVAAGDNQSAPVGKPFAAALEVLVTDALGNPAPGAGVTFTVTASGGAGATFAGGVVTITVPSDASGMAAAGIPVADSVPGAYTVAATVAGVAAPAIFHLTNLPPSLAVTGVAPSAVPAWGGAEVTITGAGFSALAPVAAVRFGAVPTTFRVSSDSQIVAVSPAGTAGQAVDVTVVLVNGLVSPIGAGDRVSFVSGGWHPAGSLGRPRTGHTATVLGGTPCSAPVAGISPAWCGMVVVVGGEGDPQHPCNPALPAAAAPPALDTAEVYDPASSRSSDTFPLDLGRTDHTATLLGDGRVLVAGGCSANQVLASAEVYDPAAGTWTPAADLGQARLGQTATLLADGRVLVVGGGAADGSAIGSAEVFDPAATSPGRAVTGAAIAAASPTVTSPSGGFGPSDVGRSVTGFGVPAGAVVAGVSGPNSLTLSAPATVAGSGVTLTLGPLAGAWAATAPLAQARQGHSATRLGDGRVLVAGGLGGGGSGTDSYEIFNPTAGTWSAPPDRMTAPRWGHSATLLPDGTVVVAGGCCTATVPPGALASTEVFDPWANLGTGGWRPGAPMSGARQGHTATLLSDGTVMVAGGSPDLAGNALAATERYDPARAVWTPSGDLVTGRRGHAAVALPGGRVMVAGGSDSAGRALSSVEQFDPTAGQPEPVVTGVEPTAGAPGATVTITGTGFFSTATVVHFGSVAAPPTWVSDSRIVVNAPPQPRGTVIVTVTRAGSPSSFPVPAARFTYAGGAWAPTGGLDGCTPSDPACVPRTRHTATLLDGPACRAAGTSAAPPWCGRVLVAGGSTAGGGSTSGAELYDPATGTWNPTAAMNQARMDHTATLLGDGTVLVAGGITQSAGSVSVVASAEIYAPATGTWSRVGDLHVARFDHTATLLGDGSVLVAGGAANPDGAPVASSEVYQPATTAWTVAAGLDSCAPDPACVPRAGQTATLVGDGTVVVVGGVGIQGSTTGPVGSAELYDLRLGTWRAAGGLPPGEQRAYHTATLLGDGRILVAGGLGGVIAGVDSAGHTGQAVLTATAWLYDPAAPAGGQWSAGPTMSAARAAHSATLLADGTVLVAGGASPLRGIAAPVQATAEVFDPAANNGTGAWTPTASMAQGRGGHSATGLDGPACRGPGAPPLWCGTVLVAGGTPGDYAGATASAEVYTPAPVVRSVTPAAGPPAGGTVVTIAGAGFTGVVAVRFGDAAAPIVSQTPTTVVVDSPAHPVGTVTVSVTSAGGSSLSAEPNMGDVFVYEDAPFFVRDLQATATSGLSVTLRFSAVAASSDPSAPPATRYVVKQSSAPIVDAATFAAATAVCPSPGCLLSPIAVGAPLQVVVGGLVPGTTYYFAVAAVNDAGIQGPFAAVAVTTPGSPPPPPGCAPVGRPARDDCRPPRPPRPPRPRAAAGETDAG